MYRGFFWRILDLKSLVEPRVSNNDQNGRPPKFSKIQARGFLN